MAEEVALYVRVPVSEVVKGLREKHKIRDSFSEVRVEADSLVFYFTRTGGAEAATEIRPPTGSKPLSAAPTAASIGTGRPPKRRRLRKRNRMKTRGWPVVGKIENSKGQTATIYKPFVEALQGGNLTPAQRREVVAKILRANGNRPGESSVEYFLNNTLEYLQQNPSSAKS